MTNPFSALFRVQPSNPAIQEAARHMIAAHKGAKPVLDSGFGATTSTAMAARAKRNAWIMRQHDAGISNADIAKAVGLDRNSVAKIIRQAKGRAKE